jgi:ABC-type dipeptide/oligopeptide/nickel transport system permease subunit
VVRHILPNVMSHVVVATTLLIPSIILIESFLSFLGLGVQPPTPSWGEMLSTGRGFLHLAPWVSVFPGVALSATVLGFNFLGDGLRDALDPRLG